MYALSQICLVSCSAEKSFHPTEAQLLYQSELFARQKQFAELFADDWRILSAKHGLLEPRQIVAPYDETLKSKSEGERRLWAEAVFNSLVPVLKRGMKVSMLAGDSYSRHLCPLLLASGVDVWEPLKGLPIGKQLQWLGRAVSNPSRIQEHIELYRLIRSLKGAGPQGETLAALKSTHLPVRGVYFFVDDEERSRFGHFARIVRVGTHAVSRDSKSTLWQRLRTHRGNDDLSGSHRSSIFRLHVGAAYIKSLSLNCATWGVGSQAAEDIRRNEAAIEAWVSSYLRKLRVYWISVPDAPHPQSDRSYIERGVLGMLSHAGSLEPASDGWLGNHSARDTIRYSGLWNLNYIGDSFPPQTLAILGEYVKRTDAHEIPIDSSSLAPKDWQIGLTAKNQGLLF